MRPAGPPAAGRLWRVPTDLFDRFAELFVEAHERWLEILKPFITVTNFAEVGAGRCMSMLMSAVPNNELRNGYHVQFVDEIRHTGMQMSLARWYAKNVLPGLTLSRKLVEQSTLDLMELPEAAF